MGRKNRNASERVTVEDILPLLTGNPWDREDREDWHTEEGGNDFPPQTFPV